MMRTMAGLYAQYQCKTEAEYTERRKVVTFIRRERLGA